MQRILYLPSEGVKWLQFEANRSPRLLPWLRMSVAIPLNPYMPSWLSRRQLLCLFLILYRFSRELRKLTKLNMDRWSYEGHYEIWPGLGGSLWYCRRWNGTARHQTHSIDRMLCVIGFRKKAALTVALKYYVNIWCMRSKIFKHVCQFYNHLINIHCETI